MEEIYFSIIIPVYKVENYLKQCVSSIIQQDFTNYEIILVDDGSPDNCPQICDELSAMYSNVYTIHKKNGGSSSARNAGMKISKGKYIIFLDSDDYYGRLDALKMMYLELELTDADILILKSQKFYMKKGTLTNCNDKSCTQDILNKKYDEQLSYCISNQLYDACAWNKVFHRSLMLHHDLYFTEGIIAEDIDWAARLSLVAKSLAILKYPVYVYRKEREGALTLSLKLKNLVDTKNSIERCIGYTEKIEMNEEKKEAYFSYIAYRYIIWIAEAEAVKDNQKRELIKQMKKYDWLLKYRLNKKVAIIYYIYRVLKYRITAYILCLYLLNWKS